MQKLSHKYNFVGELLRMRRHHTLNYQKNSDEVITEEEYKYDHTGRLKKVYHQIGNNAPILLVKNKYDELGQLIEKNLHSTNNGQSFLQSVDYGYNVKGWLKYINDVSRITPRALVEKDDSEVLQVFEKQLNELVQKYEKEPSKEPIKVDKQLLKLSTRIIKTHQEWYRASLTNPIKTKDVPTTIGVNQDSLLKVLKTLEGRFIENLAKKEIKSPKVAEVLLKSLKDEYRARWNVQPQGSKREDNEDIFAMNFRHDYIGNIRHMEWRVRGNKYRSIYDMSYDQLNRLQNANYKEKIERALFIPQYQKQGFYDSKSIAYDLAGNIKELQRWGQVSVSNNIPIAGQIDKLTYNYNANQLLSVQDGASHSKGFMNPQAINTQFSYDINGNLKEDLNKGMQIDYNHLNLPTAVQVINSPNEIGWIYDALGNKKYKKVTTNSNNTYKHYVDGIEYTDTKLEAVYHSEGRIVREVDYIQTNGQVVYKYTYEYSLKDHLGNSRVNFSDLNGNGIVEVAKNGGYNELLQQNHYYPFGLNMEGAWALEYSPQGATNQYQYNGIELQEDFGLNWNLAFYRGYDPALGRWGQVDPVDQPSLSPYNGMGNNPILFNDPLGDSIILQYTKWQPYTEKRQQSSEEGRYVTARLAYVPGKKLDIDALGISKHTPGTKLFIQMTWKALDYIYANGDYVAELEKPHPITGVNSRENGAMTAREIINKVSSSKTDILIQNNTLHPNGRVQWNKVSPIFWNATKIDGMVSIRNWNPFVTYEAGGVTRTPANSLFHELSHFYDYVNNKREFMRMINHKYNDEGHKYFKWENELEKKNVLYREYFFTKYGENQTPRLRYRTPSINPYITVDPTSTAPIGGSR